MVEFREQGTDYAARYHISGHGAQTVAANGAGPGPRGQEYLESVVSGRPPAFGGKGALAMGLSGPYDRMKFLAALEGVYTIDGRSIDVNYRRNGRRTATSKGKRVYDFGEFVISVNKSFSVGICVGKDRDKALIKSIVDHAIDDAVAHMETLARVRVTRGGVTKWWVPVGIQYADFDHMHNRRGDAHNHRHVAVMRHAMCSDGKIRTLDMSIFMQAQPEIDAVLKTSLAYRAAEAGFALNLSDNGPELRLVPPILRAAISNGTTEIEQFLKREGLGLHAASHAQKAWANAMTKLAKVQFSAGHIENVTRRKFESVGFSFDTFEVSPELAPYKLVPRISAREAVALAVEKTHTLGNLVKSRYALSLAAARCQEWSGAFSEITQEIDRLVESGYLIFRGSGTGLASRHAGGMMSRLDAVHERSAVELYKRGMNKAHPVADPATIRAVVDQLQRHIGGNVGIAGAQLPAAQAALIHRVMLSSDRVTVIVGEFGVGKTIFLLALALGLASASGGGSCTVLTSSDQLRDALARAGVASETVVFARHADTFWWHANHRTTVIVDEAGALDAGDMHVLLQRAERRGARVHLVGDSQRLHSEGKATAYRHIVGWARDRGTSAELSAINRTQSVEHRSLRVMSQAEQVVVLQKLMNADVTSGDHVKVRHSVAGGWSKTVVADVIGADGHPRSTFEIDMDESAGSQGLRQGVLYSVQAVEQARLQLRCGSGETSTLVIADGGPAGRVWSSAIRAARWEFIATRYAGLAPENRLRSPIVVDTNADLQGVTQAIRSKIGVESVFSVQTFETFNIDAWSRLESTRYKVGDFIKVNRTSRYFSKGELLAVLDVKRDRIRVRIRDGRENTFVPSRDGWDCDLGEFETCQLGDGEFVRFTGTCAEADIAYGDRGIIRSIDPRGRATIDILDAEGAPCRTTALDLRNTPVGVRAGYASTVHALAGGIVERGFYLASTASRNELLVGASRFRHGFILVTDGVTKGALEALAARVLPNQSEEPAPPTQRDIAHWLRKPVLNAAWPASKKQLVGHDGCLSFTPFPPNVAMDAWNMRVFLLQARRKHGKEVLVVGNDRFVQLAQRIANGHPELEVVVKTAPAPEACGRAGQLPRSTSTKHAKANHPG